MFRRFSEATGLARGSNSSGGEATPGAPLELIRYNQSTTKFELGEEALAVLRKVRGPVGVIAVCGRARQGKSFILNQLLGRTTGFQVAPSVRPCTKGLWMWSTPIPQIAPDGSKHHLVLLDTEGIDAYDQTGQYSTQIFSLAVLLSSLFVYNQMGGIDEAALDRLSLVTEVTKHIRVRAGSAAGESSAQELAAFTPRFVWLLRDFYLSLEDGGHQVTPKEYLETALAPLPGTDRGTRAKNQIRESITALFPDRDCFPLVRPVSDEKSLQNLESVPAAQLRPEFRKGMEQLTALMFAKAQPKRLGSDVVSGGVLAALATAYVDAINGGAVPTIATAWQGVAEAECRRAADAAEAAYCAAFRESATAPEEAALQGEHRRACEAASAAYTSAAIGEPSVRQAGDKRWRAAVDTRFAQMRDKKLASAALECEQLINRATQQLTQAARAPDATLNSLRAVLATFEREFRAAPSAKSSEAWHRHSEFMRETYGPLVEDLAARQSERKTSQLNDAKSRIADLTAALSRAEEAKRAAEQRCKAIEARATGAEERAATARQHADKEGAAAKAAHSRVAALESQYRAAESRVATLESQLQASSGRRRQEVETARQSAADEAAAQVARAHADVARSEAAAGEARRALSAAQREGASLKEEVASLRRQLQAAGSATQQQVDQLQTALEASNQIAAAAAAQRDEARQTADAAIAEQEDLQRRLEELAARKTPLRSPLPSAAPSTADAMDVGEGYATRDDGDAPVADGSGDRPDPAGMSIREIKDWLTVNRHEDKVWEGMQAKARKAQWVQILEAVL